MSDVPAVTLLADGRAVFFDDEGEQMVDLQKKNWRGLHEFLEEYPDANISFTLGKNKGIIQIERDSARERLLKQIEDYREVENDEDQEFS